MRSHRALLSVSVLVFSVFVAGGLAQTRDVKVISSAGARALADACTAWAEQNKQVVAIAILD